MVNVRKNILNL